jgi:hypothetical protein
VLLTDPSLSLVFVARIGFSRASAGSCPLWFSCSRQRDFHSCFFITRQGHRLLVISHRCLISVPELSVASSRLCVPLRFFLLTIGRPEIVLFDCCLVLCPRVKRDSFLLILFCLGHFLGSLSAALHNTLSWPDPDSTVLH